MLSSSLRGLVASILLPLLASAACTPNTTDTAGLQALLTQGAEGYTLQLCASQIYSLTDILNYTAASQEISTEGYPQDDTRAILRVTGTGQSTALSATNSNLNGVKLLNVQIDGNRAPTEAIYTNGGGNIEFGGDNQNQVVEYVRSHDPRGWSCMHFAEGPFTCANATIQNNDIGPCGSEYFQNWADGISLSCSSSLVQNNVITDITDGGIVIFGAPFSTIRNNTIRVQTRTMLGGINMVDVLPWLPEGNYSHTLVENNMIHGGYATTYGNSTLGPNNASAVIKIGIALGPDVWWSDGRYGTNQSQGGTIQNNVLSGGFSFGMAVSSAKNFVIQNNSFTGNESFVGSYGVNCTTGTKLPHAPTALLLEPTSITNVTISVPSDSIYEFVNGTALGVTCFTHPDSNTNSWPYGDGGVNSDNAESSESASTTASGTNGGSETKSGTATSAASTSSTSKSSSSASGRRASGLGTIAIALGISIAFVSAGAGFAIVH